MMILNLLLLLLASPANSTQSDDPSFYQYDLLRFGKTWLNAGELPELASGKIRFERNGRSWSRREQIGSRIVEAISDGTTVTVRYLDGIEVVAEATIEETAVDALTSDSVIEGLDINDSDDGLELDVKSSGAKLEKSGIPCSLEVSRGTIRGQAVVMVQWVPVDSSIRKILGFIEFYLYKQVGDELLLSGYELKSNISFERVDLRKAH